MFTEASPIEAAAVEALSRSRLEKAWMIGRVLRPDDIDCKVWCSRMRLFEFVQTTRVVVPAKWVRQCSAVILDTKKYDTFREKIRDA